MLCVLYNLRKTTAAVNFLNSPNQKSDMIAEFVYARPIHWPLAINTKRGYVLGYVNAGVVLRMCLNGAAVPQLCSLM